MSRVATKGDWAHLKKRRYVKDPLWQSILLFPWEKILIEHPVYNRLNDVLQNSSAFRVYPGLRVTRFIHSLGVMHVATNMFQSIASSCSPREADPSDKRGHTRVAAFLAEAQSINNKGREFAQNEVSLVYAYVRRDTPLSYLGNQKNEQDLALLIAAIRIAALVHDIGHLPYSHVAEHALTALYLSQEPILPRKNAATEEAFRLTMADLLGRKAPAFGLASEDFSLKPHETLGSKLIPLLQKIFHQKVDANSDATEMQLLSRLLGISKTILHSDTLPISQSFLKGTIDADRIDFVYRDTMFSGLLSSSVDYGRLFSFYTLQDATRKNTQIIAVAPSSRASSEVKKILWERFQDYKFIVCHHRVHFFDELIQRCIIELVRMGYLTKFIERIVRLSTTLTSVHAEISVLLDEINMRMDLVTSLDDHWLEMQFRKAFAESLTNVDLDSGKRTTATFSAWTKDLLTAYASERSLFKSAFKTDEEFWQYCEVRSRSYLTELFNEKNLVKKRVGLRGVAQRVNANKYVWEREIREASGSGNSVIIGDVSGKLSIGMSASEAATMLSLDSFAEFLETEVTNTMPFNFWYKHSGINSSERRDVIFDMLLDKIDGQRHLSF